MVGMFLAMPIVLFPAFATEVLKEPALLGLLYSAEAIGAMVAAGRTQIVEAAVIGDGEEPCVPCGGCRQRLREFMPLDATVHLLAEKGARASMTLAELLPRSFGPEYLP